MRRCRVGLYGAAGFTLLELAVVLVIVALLIGGMLIPLSAQNDIRYVAETQRRLRDAQDALLGYAVSNGRLPCPAVGGGTGIESFVGTAGASACTTREGFLPAVTLSIAPTDSQGYALDAWNQRLRYAITDQNSGTYTYAQANGMKTIGLASLKPDLRICASYATCTTAPLSTNAVVVIWSIGKNGSNPAVGGVSADEQENPNPNSTAYPDPHVGRYVSHEQSPDFDDLVIWLSPNILYNRMIAAGQLP